MTEITAGGKKWWLTSRCQSCAPSHEGERWRCQTRLLIIDVYYDGRTKRWCTTCLYLNISGRVLQASAEWTREEALLRALLDLQVFLQSMIKEVAVP